jgi:hypothetical protein
MTKKNCVSGEELLALLARLEAQSLKEGDAQILKAVIKKTFTLRQLYWEGKMPSKDKLRRLLAIPRPETSDE